MRKPEISAILFVFLLILPVSFSQEETGDFDTSFGVDVLETSAADPEFVAQEKFTEEVTSVYNWIAANGTEFIQGCRADRSALVTRLSDVIKNAQEASNVCRQFEEEAESCTPDFFCSRFEKGIPFPPEVKSALKQMGKDPDSIKAEEVDRDFAMQMCKAMFGKEIGRMKAQQDKMKENLKSQVPKFRESCKKMEEFREKGMQGPQLPTFDFSFDQGPPQGQGNYGSQGPNYGRGGCQGGGPTVPCGNGSHPVCDNGSWRCEQSRPDKMGCQGSPPNCGQGMYPACEGSGWNCRDDGSARNQQGPPQSYLNECSKSPPQCPGGAPSDCSTGRWVCGQPSPDYQPPPQQPAPDVPQTQPQESVAPVPEQSAPAPAETAPVPEQPAPAPEPAPPAPEPAAPAPEPTATTSSKKEIIIPLRTTGLEVLASDQPREQPIGSYGPPSGRDQYGSGQDYGPPQGYGSNGQQGFGPPQGNEGYGNRDFGSNYGSEQGQQGFGQGQRGPGPSPEELCELSDDELIERFMGDSQNYGPKEEDAQAMCAQEAGKIVKEFSKMKLGIAQCRANAALECAAKKESAKSCNAARENPAAISEQIVNGMCRKYGIRADSKDAKGGLYEVAKKFYDQDPALAQQLGDSADKTIEDKQKLSILSYVFGDPNYGQTLKQRSEKLRAIKAKLSDEEDKEVITQIEDEISKLDQEGNQFNNFLDVGRIGRIFGGSE